MEAQVGSVSLPILITPRIDDQAVTVTQIKTVYSGKWTSDPSTPMSFLLELKDEFGNITSVTDSGSTDSQLNFPVPDSVYANVITYTVMVYWVVKNTGGTIIEKVPTIQPLTLEVADLHQRK